MQTAKHTGRCKKFKNVRIFIPNKQSKISQPCHFFLSKSSDSLSSLSQPNSSLSLPSKVLGHQFFFLTRVYMPTHLPQWLILKLRNTHRSRPPVDPRPLWEAGLRLQLNLKVEGGYENVSTAHLGDFLEDYAAVFGQYEAVQLLTSSAGVGAECCQCVSLRF